MRETFDMDVLGYEYPGYGLSVGPDGPSEIGCYAAINAAYHYVIHDLGVDPSRIVLYVLSLGTGEVAWSMLMWMWMWMFLLVFMCSCGCPISVNYVVIDAHLVLMLTCCGMVWLILHM